MDKVSRYFNRSEFACRCGCGFSVVDTELLKVLEKVRERFGPVIITSACRCKLYNENVGGSPTSKHMLGIAADFHCPGVNPRRIFNFLYEYQPYKYGLGLYSWGVHLDVRNVKNRWNESDIKKEPQTK